MSKYSEDMRRALQTYRDTKQKAEASYKQIEELYGKEALEREKARQEARMQAARQTAESAIQEAYSNGRYLAKQWGSPTGSQLTDDIRLFDAGLVTPEVFEQLKARYKDNATMSAALKAQGEKLNAAAVKEAKAAGDVMGIMKQTYNTHDIVTAEDKMKYWDDLKRSAIDMLDALDGKGQYSDPWGQAVGRAMSGNVIDHFGE